MATILVIDDEREWRDLYAQVLGKSGHEIRAASNGQDFVEMVRAGLPDLVILDAKMTPSGRKLSWVLRRNWPGLPVIVASAYGGYRNDPEFAGVAAFVEKTADLGELVRAVEEVLARTAPRAAPAVDGGEELGADADGTTLRV